MEQLLQNTRHKPTRQRCHEIIFKRGVRAMHKKTTDDKYRAKFWKWYSKINLAQRPDNEVLIITFIWARKLTFSYFFCCWLFIYNMWKSIFRPEWIFLKSQLNLITSYLSAGQNYVECSYQEITRSGENATADDKYRWEIL